MFFVFQIRGLAAKGRALLFGLQIEKNETEAFQILTSCAQVILSFISTSVFVFCLWGIPRFMLHACVWRAHAPGYGACICEANPRSHVHSLRLHACFFIN